MRAGVAGLNLLLGVVYMSYGAMTIIDMRRGWEERGFSPLAHLRVPDVRSHAHIAFVVYAAAGTYTVDTHGLIIDWLAVPAALYFVWVVRSAIYLEAFDDWNRSSAGSHPVPVAA